MMWWEWRVTQNRGTKMNATQKFTGKAGGYAKYRPHYPEDFIDYLIASNSLHPGSVIADIGSGTGILTAQMLDRGYTVMAVEPNRDMREEAEKLLCANPAFRSVNGAAEATTLGAGSVDLVTVAQAFHWFDRERFKTECKRILKKGSRVALVWNTRVQGCELVRENEEICRKFCPNFVSFGSGIESDQAVFEQFFKSGSFEFKAFHNDEHNDLDGFIGRSLSASYAPRQGDGNYAVFIGELAGLFEKYSANGIIVLPSETHSYMGCV
jgi:SAM-dependent methyltransferase